MTFKTIPGLSFNGSPVGYDDGAVVTPPTPPSPPVVVVPPALIAGRSQMVTPISWINGKRYLSPGVLGPGNYWAFLFTPPTTGFSTVRMVGAENGGGPQMREWVLFRADTGAIVQKDSRPLSTVQLRLAVNRAPDPRHFEARVDQGVDYILAIITSVGLPPSAMFMDLFLS